MEDVKEDEPNTMELEVDTKMTRNDVVEEILKKVGEITCWGIDPIKDTEFLIRNTILTPWVKLFDLVKKMNSENVLDTPVCLSYKVCI